MWRVDSAFRSSSSTITSITCTGLSSEIQYSNRSGKSTPCDLLPPRRIISQEPPRLRGRLHCLSHDAKSLRTIWTRCRRQAARRSRGDFFPSVLRKCLRRRRRPIYSSVAGKRALAKVLCARPQPCRHCHARAGWRRQGAPCAGARASGLARVLTSSTASRRPSRTARGECNYQDHA